MGRRDRNSATHNEGIAKGLAPSAGAAFVDPARPRWAGAGSGKSDAVRTVWRSWVVKGRSRTMDGPGVPRKIP